MESGWTFDTLYAHFAERMQAQKEMVALALAAAKEAVTKAEAASERRFAAVNEFRETLADQQRTLMPRLEAQFQIDALRKEVEALKEANMRQTSRGIGQGQVVAWVVAAVSFAGAVTALILKFT